MAQDFKANQIRTSQIIVSGSNGSKAGLLIYGSGSSTNTTGGYLTSLKTGVGSDVIVFVSGSIAGRGKSGSTLVGGDLITSGALIALNGVCEISSTSKNSIVALKSVNDSTELIQNTVGNFSLRNQRSGGDLVISAKTSGGVVNNFIDFRPKGALTGSVLSIFPVSIFPGAANPFNSSDTNFFVAGGRNKKDGKTGGTAVFGGDLVISGSTFLGTNLTDVVNFRSSVGSDIIPDQDRLRNLGSSGKRFANIYTGDLHLKNERGDYTLIEEEDCLTIRFNKTGKRYKFVLEPAPEYDDK